MKDLAIALAGERVAARIRAGTFGKQGDTVYFIQTRCPVGYIKIGIASDANRRLREMQVHCPYEMTLLGTMPGGRKAETELHKRFGAAGERGEWFHPTEELLAFIEALPKPPLRPDPVPENMFDDFRGTVSEEDDMDLHDRR